MATHSYVDECELCSGHLEIIENTRPPHTSEECYDCGWWETNEEGYEGSGFRDLNEINDLRMMDGMDELSHEDLVATRIRINGPVPLPPYDEYACVINRRPASRDP